MSWFSSIVKGVVAAAQFVVKATVAVVHTVVRSVKKAVDVFKNETGTLKERLGKSFKAAGETIFLGSEIVKAEYNLLREKLGAIVATGSADLSYPTLLAEVLVMMSKLNAAKNAINSTDTGAAQQTKKVNEAIKEMTEHEVILRLKIQEERLDRLLKHASKIEADDSMHDIQRLARLEISVKFMTSLKDGKVLTSEEQGRFLELVEKFLYNKLKDQEVIELDEIIETREGRTLLALGNEYLVKLYETQLADLKTAIEKQEDELEILEQSANPEREQEKASLEKLLEANKSLLLTTNALLLVTQGFQFVYDHEMEFYEGGKLNEDEWILEKCMEVSNFFIEVVRAKTAVDQTKLLEIEAFGRAVRSIREQYGDFGQEGTTSVS